MIRSGVSKEAEKSRKLFHSPTSIDLLSTENDAINAPRVPSSHVSESFSGKDMPADSFRRREEQPSEKSDSLMKEKNGNSFFNCTNSINSKSELEVAVGFPSDGSEEAVGFKTEAVGISSEGIEASIKGLEGIYDLTHQPPDLLGKDLSPPQGLFIAEKLKGQRAPSLDYSKLLKAFPQHFSRKRHSNSLAVAFSSNPDLLEQRCTHEQTSTLPIRSKNSSSSPLLLKESTLSIPNSSSTFSKSMSLTRCNSETHTLRKEVDSDIDSVASVSSEDIDDFEALDRHEDTDQPEVTGEDINALFCQNEIQNEKELRNHNFSPPKHSELPAHLVSFAKECGLVFG